MQVPALPMARREFAPDLVLCLAVAEQLARAPVIHLTDPPSIRVQKWFWRLYRLCQTPEKPRGVRTS
jgi:hypothetical protein